LKQRLAMLRPTRLVLARVVNGGQLVGGFFSTAIICSLLCAVSVAQQSPASPAPDAPSASAQSQTAPQGANPLQSSVAFFQLLQRKSVVFPDLATNAGPFNSWQKFKLAANSSVSISTIGSALIASAFDQAINSPAGYHQGGEGYAKRFGADMARSASANLFGTFLIASVLHEDPRFYVRKHLSFKQSLKYAAVRVAVTRSDRGERVVNFAGLLGPLAGEGLADTYYPEGNRGVGSTFTRYASDLGWKFGGNLLRQYWPSINRKLRLAPPQLATTPNPSQP
jgi:hypothetical protein